MYKYGDEGWQGFPDLWSGKKTLMELIFNRCGEFRWSPEGPVSQIHSPHLNVGASGIFSDLLSLFRCWRESVVRKATVSYRTYSFLVKLQPWFLILWWKTCLWADLQSWFLRLKWRTCPWAEHSQWWDTHTHTPTHRCPFHKSCFSANKQNQVTLWLTLTLVFISPVCLHFFFPVLEHSVMELEKCVVFRTECNKNSS